EKGPFMSEPRLEPVLFPMGTGVRLAYKVMVEREDVPAYYEAVVDATDGTLLHRYNLTQYVQTDGLVFPQDPGKLANVPVKIQFFDDSIKMDPKWPLGWAFADKSIGN